MFLKEMIEIISPENILCEGIETFNELMSIYDDVGETFWRNGAGYTKVSNPNFNLIVYNRNTATQESLSKILKKVIHSE